MCGAYNYEYFQSFGLTFFSNLRQSGAVALITVTLILLLPKYSINAHEEKKEPHRVDGISFNTNLIEDSAISTFMENYISIRLKDNMVVPTEISFCFRWQFHSLAGHCFFDETNLGIFFKRPTISKVGYVVLFQAYVMFEIPDDINWVPLVWHHICVSYKNYNLLLMIDGRILLKQIVEAFKQLNSTKIALKTDLTLGNVIPVPFHLCKQFQI